jgi:cobalt-zinc-cadmium efflux system outer membrane protein
MIHHPARIQLPFHMQRIPPLVGCLFMAACATSSDDAGAPSARLTPPPPSAAVNYAVPRGSGPDEMARLAIRHHPSLAAARHRAERLAAVPPQRAALPDPMLEITPIGQMAETASGEVMTMGAVSQKFPFPGKRAQDAATATREAEAAAAEIEALELRLTEQVHAAWWDLHLAGQTVALTRESRDILDALRTVVDARVAADQAAQADQLSLTNERTQLDRDLAEAALLADTARARINSLLNRPSGAPLPATRGTPIPSSAALETLHARAQMNHPEVAAAERRAEAFRHRLRRAELEKYPDFALTVGGASVSSSGRSPMADGRDQWYAGIGLNIPLWQEPRRAMIREARAGIAETDAMLASTRSEIRYRVEEAWYRARTAREVAVMFETRLVPDARQAYEVTLTGYSAGTSNFNELMESWRQHLGYRLQLANNQAQLGKAAATLRAAAGIR